MTVEPSRFPFVAEFLEQKFGTLYVLCDSAVRLRDAVSVVALTRFFAAAGVRLDVRPVLTKHRRFLSARNIRDALTPDRVAQFDAARAGDAGVPALVDLLFGWAESQFDQEGADGETRVGELAVRGPIVILGRPQLYPDSFRELLATELTQAGRDLVGRFSTPYSELEGDNPEFWTVHDRYYNVTHTVAGEQGRRDYGIIRKVRGRFSSRTMLFAYGTSSLGTVGATQMLIDEDQNEELVAFKVQEHFARHGEIELLISAKRDSPSRRPSVDVISSDHGELRPRELRVFLGPSAPVSSEAMAWITILTSEREDDRLAAVYRRESSADGVTRFAVTGSYPKDAVSARMIGGAKVAETVAVLEAIGSNLDRRIPVLLVGPTGVGKELAGRILYETRVLALLRRMAEAGVDPNVFPAASPVVGAHFSAVNCAGMTEELAESTLFGIATKRATGVAPSRGVILGAGEGVAFLDEIAFTNAIQQGRLLRAVQPPFFVNPVGFHPVPCASLIAAAMSAPPEKLVKEGRMLPELLARFRAGLVRIDSLADRPGDVPALLCAIAGRPIRMDEDVLRCLIAGEHPENVRGLYEIVSRALASGRDTDGSRDALRIGLSDIGASNELREHFRLAERKSRVRWFEFRLDTPPLVPPEVFEAGAAVLTSVVVDGGGELRVRKPPPDMMLEFGPSGFTGVADAAEKWVGAVADVVQRVPKDRREPCLKRLGWLCDARFGTAGICQAFRSELVRAKNHYSNLRLKDIAESINRDPSQLSR